MGISNHQSFSGGNVNVNRSANLDRRNVILFDQASNGLSCFRKNITGRIHVSKLFDARSQIFRPAKPKESLLNGHLKSGQRWSLQNRPTDVARDAMVLR